MTRRFVYIPIRKVYSEKELTKTELDGISWSEGWKLYKTKTSEIEKWGLYLLRRFATKPGGAHNRILRTGQIMPLVQTAGSDNVVYVHCHGNSEFVGLRPLKLTPQQLAKRLKNDGLSLTNTPTVKLWSCHSAEALLENDDTYLEKVAQAMQALGYKKATIYGYEGELCVNHKGKHKLSTVDGESTRASDRRFAVEWDDASSDSDSDFDS